MRHIFSDAYPCDHNGMNILTVGDGDLSFSLALARCFGSQINLTATTLLESEEELLKTYESASNNLKELRCQNDKKTVIFNVDATKLHTLSKNQQNKDNSVIKYDIVMFNHPHLGFSELSNEEKHAQKHHSLISHFLFSAKSIIKEKGGCLHLCLCGEQPKTWRLLEASNRCGWKLIHSSSTSEPFENILRATNDHVQNFRTSTKCVNDIHSSTEKVKSNSSPLTFKPQPIEKGWQAPRRFRNGRLGSRHWLGKYGYIHRRTHGDHHVGQRKDMNVSNSINFVFVISDTDKSKNDDNSKIPPIASNSITIYKCPICDTIFDSNEEFQQHLNDPGSPDPIFESLCEETGKRFKTQYALETFQNQKSLNIRKRKVILEENEISSSNSTISHQNFTHCERIPDIENYLHEQVDRNIQIAIVNIEGKRLRWWARQPEAFGEETINSISPKHHRAGNRKASIKSKSQCEKLIKSGCFRVNGSKVLDSSRILHFGDKVEWITNVHLNKKTSNNLPSIDNNVDWSKISSLQDVQIVKQIHKNYHVAWKPVGFRSRGNFSDMSVESILFQKYQESYLCLSRLEKGCSGLCLVRKEDQIYSKSKEKHTKNKAQRRTPMPNDEIVSYAFTALLHGLPPLEWKTGVTKPIPIDNLRNWRAKQICKDDDRDHTHTNGIIDTATNRLSLEGTPNIAHDSEAIEIKLLESASLVEGDEDTILSSVRLTCNKREGKLCSSICYMLRKLNYPVVGDRFCKRELSVLPRSCRNMMKSKLHIGCFGIRINNALLSEEISRDCSYTDVQVPLPARFSALYWKETLS